LKIVRTGVASREALRRFQDEARVLARLQHPNIAQIYETGTHSDDGGSVPFFVMEYIPDSLSISEYTARHRNEDGLTHS